MLGGEDDDDDLEEILQECNAQPNLQINFGNVDESAPLNAREEPSTSDKPEAGLADPTIKAILKQNEMLMAAILNQSQGPEKRKTQEEVNYSQEDPILLFEESYRLEDDAHEKIDTRLRQRLRPINSAPESYYSKGAFARVEKPILGETLYLEHIMPNNVNPSVKCKMHDRCAMFEIKNLLTKNAGVARENQKRLRVKEITNDEFSMGIETQWLPATEVYEVVDAGFNFLCCEFMIRNYSYTAIAIMRCLHEVRYFCGVSGGSPKMQRILIESYFNDCFAVSLLTFCNGQCMHPNANMHYVCHFNMLNDDPQCRH